MILIDFPFILLISFFTVFIVLKPQTIYNKLSYFYSMFKLNKRGVETIWVILLIVLLFILMFAVGNIISNIIKKGTA